MSDSSGDDEQGGAGSNGGQCATPFRSPGGVPVKLVVHLTEACTQTDIAPAPQFAPPHSPGAGAATPGHAPGVSGNNGVGTPHTPAPVNAGTPAADAGGAQQLQPEPGSEAYIQVVQHARLQEALVQAYAK